jgi:hypothetical protein
MRLARAMPHEGVAMYERDRARIPNFFSDEALYWDVAVGPPQAARGG